MNVDSECEAFIPATNTFATATDNCGVNSLTSSPAGGSKVGRGTGSLTYDILYFCMCFFKIFQRNSS